MDQIVKVILWGDIIGYLGYPHKEKTAIFEYDKNFVKKNISPSPLLMPVDNSIYKFSDISFRTFHGLPGFIADSLPDKFGNQLIDYYFSQKGIDTKDITALDRLLYVGNRSMGALEYEPSENLGENKASIALSIEKLAELAELVLDKKEILSKELEKAKNKEEALRLVKIGSSAGGARSKALVAINEKGEIFDGGINHRGNYRYYLLKFDSSNNSDRDGQDPRGMTRVEYIYSLIAKKCEIKIPDTNYIIDKNGNFHFLIERFDRIKKEDGSMDKLHYVSWAGLEHAHRDTTGAYGYEQLVITARKLGLGQDDITEIFKRAIFNIVGRNQDDHTKNFGFLMDRNGNWKLSPAFDMTYSYDPSGAWTRVHQIMLNGKQDDFTEKDIIEFGNFCDIGRKKAKEILNNTIEAFLDFEALSNKYEVDPILTSDILLSLRTNITDSKTSPHKKTLLLFNRFLLF